MATVIDSLLIRLGFDSDTSGAASFDSGLGKIIKTAGVVGAAITGMGIAVGGALAKVAIDTAEAVDETARLAEVADVTASELQRLTVGAERYGISQEKLADILKDVSDKTGDFLAGEAGGMADFFKNVGNEVGVTAEAFKGLSSAEGLQLYVSTLEDANVSQAEMTFYMEAIASDATMLLPLLKDGGKGFKEWGDEAQRAGLLMSEADIAKSVDFVDKLEKAKLVYKGLVSEMTRKVVPYANQALEWVIANEDNIKAVAESIANGFTVAIDAIGAAYQFIGEKIQWINDNSQAIITTMQVIGGIAAVIGAALLIMYAPAIAGFLVMQAIALASFIAISLGAIAAAVATAAAWLIAFAPFLLIGAVIAVVIGLLWLIYQNWQQIVAGLAAEWERLKGIFAAGVASISAWWSGLMASISSAFSSVIGYISAAWSGLWGGVKAIAGGAIDYVIGKIQSVIGMITSAIGKVKELAAYNPVALGGKAASWAAGKLGIGGGGSNTSNVNQTFNVSSANAASNIARNSTGAQRRSNTGVKQ